MVKTFPGIGGRRVHPTLSGDILKFQIGRKLYGTYIEKLVTGVVEERGDLCLHQNFSF